MASDTDVAQQRQLNLSNEQAKITQMRILDVDFLALGHSNLLPINYQSDVRHGFNAREQILTTARK
jgi:hypothetical protein